jgi:hypothetical protein
MTTIERSVGTAVDRWYGIAGGNAQQKQQRSRALCEFTEQSHVPPNAGVKRRAAFRASAWMMG